MAKRAVCLAVWAAAFACPSFVGAADVDAEYKTVVQGEKLDSGLGELAERKAWSGARPVADSAVAEKPVMRSDYRVPGEKLDSGLGDLVARGWQTGFAVRREPSKDARP